MPSHARAVTLPRCSRRQSGLTLIELAITTAIIAILLGLAAPSVVQFAQRQRLEAAAAQLETDLFLLRSEAVARNETLRISFAQDPGGSCYILHGGAEGACRCGSDGTTRCASGAEVLRGAFFGQATGMRLVSNRPALVVDPTQGTVTPTATMRVLSNAGELRQVINIMGRVRACSPDGSIPGYRPC